MSEPLLVLGVLGSPPPFATPLSVAVDSERRGGRWPDPGRSGNDRARLGNRHRVMVSAPWDQATSVAALAGLGWGMNPDMLVAEHLHDGRLVALAPDQPLDVALFWQRSRIASSTLADITRAVLSTAR